MHGDHALAVAEVAHCRGHCTAFADLLSEHQQTGRDMLNRRLLKCQQNQVKGAMLLDLDSTARPRLQPFKVQLQQEGSCAPRCSASRRKQSVLALAGMPEPPIPGEVLSPEGWSQWCTWLRCMQDSNGGGHGATSC